MTNIVVSSSARHLALPERVPQVLHWDFLMPQVLTPGPTTYLPPVRIAALLPATCITSLIEAAVDSIASLVVGIIDAAAREAIALVATEPAPAADPAPASVTTDLPAGPRTIEHAHVGWNDLPFDIFAAVRLAFERAMDRSVQYLSGQDTNVQWAAAISDLHKAVQVAARGSNPKRSAARNRVDRPGAPPSGTSSVLYNNPVDLARQHQKKMEEGQRLSQRLDDLMNLKVELSEGRCLVGEYRFVLHPRRDGSDGVIVGKRQWGDYYQDHPRVVFTQQQMAEALADLGAIGKPGAGATEEVRRGKIIVDRSPVTEIVLASHAASRPPSAQAEIDDLNEARRDLARKTLTDLAGKMQQPTRSHVEQRH
jgi:hypothetical protein